MQNGIDDYNCSYVEKVKKLPFSLIKFYVRMYDEDGHSDCWEFNCEKEAQSFVKELKSLGVDKDPTICCKLLVTKTKEEILYESKKY